jgi:hypothetical protein
LLDRFNRQQSDKESGTSKGPQPVELPFHLEGYNTGRFQMMDARTPLAEIGAVADVLSAASQADENPALYARTANDIFDRMRRGDRALAITAHENTATLGAPAEIIAGMTLSHHRTDFYREFNQEAEQRNTEGANLLAAIAEPFAYYDLWQMRTAFISPSVRRQGLFSYMVGQARQEVGQQGILMARSKQESKTPEFYRQGGFFVISVNPNSTVNVVAPPHNTLPKSLKNADAMALVATVIGHQPLTGEKNPRNIIELAALSRLNDITGFTYKNPQQGAIYLSLSIPEGIKIEDHPLVQSAQVAADIMDEYGGYTLARAAIKSQFRNVFEVKTGILASEV